MADGSVFPDLSAAKAQARQQTAGDAANEKPNLPVITIEAGKLPELATEGERAIATSGLPVFQRGCNLVRPIRQDVSASGGRTTIAAGLREISNASMIDTLAQAATWHKYDGRAKSMRACDPPALVASVILSRAGLWTLPVVRGVITTPTLRPDGSLLSVAGYDPTTRLYMFLDEAVVMPPIAAVPSRGDAEQAIAVLNDLLVGFPFVSPVDRAVALSALITPVVRGAMAVAPLHAIRASTAGTGKSYLADLASVIATGRPCPVVAAGPTAEETEKRLVSLILGGFPMISIDNVNGELGGDLLCQVVERPLVRVRPLGRSEIVELEISATLLATGNALRVRGDMTRRTIISDLDAGIERPETRTFTFDPVQRVLSDRGRYVAAALTVVRAYIQAGSPDRLNPIASFGEWSDRVRSPLAWLGQADPVASMEAARNDDPELAELREVIAIWIDRLGTDRKITAREIADLASRRSQDDQGYPGHELQMPDLHDALVRVAGDRGMINTIRLGKWLLGNEGRIVGGHRLKRDTTMAHGGVARWYLDRVAKREDVQT